jgi:predicted esterase
MRFALSLLLAACATGRLDSDVTFATYSPLSRNEEIARRVLPPVSHRRLAGAHLAEQAIDLAHERFDVYVPPGAPPAAGYGLVVFVAPWQEPTRPRVWRSALDRHGLIFVSAQRSGNGTSTLDRRLPLALLAYENAHARFHLDPARVYIAGFSGGARVAEIAALAYPDIFRGALLEAGADPIDGREGMYKPPAELMPALQHTRFVFATGELDVDIQRQDDVAQASFRDACIFDLETQIAARLGHESLDGVAFGRAIDALETHAVDEAALARCNERVARELAAKVAAVAEKRARGESVRADVEAIDAAYGGLSAPFALEP